MRRSECLVYLVEEYARPLGSSLLRRSARLMLAAVQALLLSSAGFCPSPRTAAPLTAYPRHASLTAMNEATARTKVPLELPTKLLDLGLDEELWSQAR